MLDDQNNENLARPVTTNEIKYALFSMHTKKALGPNGFILLFYQKFWGTNNPDLFNIINSIMESDHIHCELNLTFFLLFPKADAPESLDQFCPISLYNVSYIIFAKIFAKRIELYLDRLISSTQSTFVKGCQISDNLIIDHKVICTLNKEKGLLAASCQARYE